MKKNSLRFVIRPFGASPNRRHRAVFSEKTIYSSGNQKNAAKWLYLTKGFTLGNGCFKYEHNEEIGHSGQTLHFMMCLLLFRGKRELATKEAKDFHEVARRILSRRQAKSFEWLPIN